jgi:hypothetical protein
MIDGNIIILQNIMEFNGFNTGCKLNKKSIKVQVLFLSGEANWFCMILFMLAATYVVYKDFPGFIHHSSSFNS